MGNKPNWGAGIGAALSAAGRGLYGAGMQKRRQGFIEDERRMREADMLKRMEMLQGYIGDRFDKGQEATEDRFSRNLDATSDWRDWQQENATAGRALQERGLDLNEQRLGLSQALGESLIAQRAQPDAPPEMTPYQRESLDIRREQMGQPSTMDKFLMQQAQREEDAIEREQRKEFRDDVNDTQGAIFDDIKGKQGVITTGEWKPVVGNRNLFERKVDVPWWRDTTEQITLSELAAQRIAPQIADGELDDFDYAVIRKLARNLGIDPMDVVETWDPILQQQYMDMEKNPLSKEQKSLIDGM